MQCSSVIKGFLKKFHSIGCPVYVLRSQLQEGKSLPKFEPRSRVGIFLGNSSQHSDNVALVLNPKTNHISAQYHILFDDKFETIKSGKTTDS